MVVFEATLLEVLEFLFGKEVSKEKKMQILEAAQVENLKPGEIKC